MKLTITIIISLLSCTNLDINSIMSVKNPTEFIFPYKLDSIKSIIKKKLGHGEFYGLSLASKDNILLYDVFKDTKNSNDFVLEEFSTWHMCKSKVYFKKNGEPHTYHGTYHIHLESLGTDQTKVSIIILESGIIYKTKLPVMPHLNRVHKLKELPPTTVEEYEILQIIGKGLGLDMPPVKIPERIIIRK